ncbi:hypothetical protein [Arcanobacterium phocae]|uniref:hypothetical protein n=1 Tax=Arcanobacterium phocae TaxID=131112 RepID=UPI001C0EF6A0|nr:hypothetical protein [Arcanobacterium phocae]
MNIKRGKMTTAVVAVAGLLLSFMTAVPALSAENSSSPQYESASVVEANSENKSFNFSASAADNQQIRVLLSDDMVDEGMVTFERVGDSPNGVSLKNVTLAGESLESDSYTSVEASNGHNELITVQLDRDSEQTVKDAELIITYSAPTVDSQDSWKLNPDVDAFTLATPDKERGVVQPRAAGLPSGISLRVDVFPTNPDKNEPVYFKYTFTNNSSLDLWWLDKNGSQQTSNILSDALCSPVLFSSGKWIDSQGYRGIRAGNSATLVCQTTFDEPGVKTNNITVEAGSLWSGLREKNKISNNNTLCS